MAVSAVVRKNERSEIQLNQVESGVINSLCEEYEKLNTEITELAKDLEIIKDKLKNKLNENADYLTKNYRIVISITPEKTEFKYNTDKIIEVYPEIKDNEKFGNYKTKKEVKSLKSVQRLVHQ